MAENIHPDCVEAFSQGLGAVFRQWTALELAVHNQWGGPNSAEKADTLMRECLALFEDPRNRYKDEVAMLIEDFCDANLSMVCEDGSPDEIGELLVMMWNQCSQGDFTLVRNAVGREEARQNVIGASQGLEGGDIIDEDDMDGGGGDAPNEEEPEEPPAPIVDEDGFQTVMRARKPRKCKKG